MAPKHGLTNQRQPLSFPASQTPPTNSLHPRHRRGITSNITRQQPPSPHAGPLARPSRETIRELLQPRSRKTSAARPVAKHQRRIEAITRRGRRVRCKRTSSKVRGPFLRRTPNPNCLRTIVWCPAIPEAEHARWTRWVRTKSRWSCSEEQHGLAPSSWLGEAHL